MLFDISPQQIKLFDGSMKESYNGYIDLSRFIIFNTGSPGV